MNIEVIGRLSEEDLERYRRASHYRKLVEMGHCGFSVEQCVNILTDFGRVLCDIIERYEIEPGTFPMVSTVDGSIVEKY